VVLLVIADLVFLASVGLLGTAALAPLDRVDHLAHQEQVELLAIVELDFLVCLELAAPLVIAVLVFLVQAVRLDHLVLVEHQDILALVVYQVFQEHFLVHPDIAELKEK
jgi:hypothetical protein